MSVNHHLALNVEMDADVRFDINTARAGFIARRDDNDPDTYLGARFGPFANTNFELFAVIDGVVTVIDDVPLPYLFTLIAQDIDFHMRMRVATQANGDLSLAFKFWEIDVGEPPGWLFESTLSDTSPAPLDAVFDRFATQSGRFGLYASLGQAGRTALLDDFRARFFEGDQLGELNGPGDQIRDPSPLRRAAASYRVCTGDSPCTEGQGCCTADSECGIGLKCNAGESQLFGFGSHAKTCSAAHCSNQLHDFDEVRADCGGADCAPCYQCTAGSSGNSGFCTAACPCGIGEGDCVSYTQCLPGLYCLQRGFNYGNVPTADDVCIPQHCRNRQLDTNLGEGPNPDCGGECGTCAAPPGYCTVYAPCGPGGSDCDYSTDCLPGLVCGNGARWPGSVGNTCNGAHCDNNVLDGNETTVDCGGDCGPTCL